MIVFPDFIMQMRGSGFTRIPDVPDDLSAFYLIPFFHIETVQVGVKCNVSVSVIYLDLVAVSPSGMFRLDHPAFTGSINRSSLWRREVNTLVKFLDLVNRVNAVAVK